ncbi:MAG: cell division protein ZapA [Bacteroidales bacterium]|nr:cell division protein ZapA [Bacteroidales bacterium]
MNEDKITIRINVADRYYPITIKRSDEESFREVGKQINDVYLKMCQLFPGKDSQDYLAMTLLQMVIKSQQTEKQTQFEEFVKKIEQLDKTIEDFLVIEQVL